MTEFFKDVRPIFLLGAPRSGTTFLHQVINRHPRVYITDELRFVSWLVQETKKLEEGYDRHGNHYPFHHGADFASYLTANAGKLVAPFYFDQAARSGKEDILYWGDKYPHYDEVLPVMPEMFPRASYVMIHRDLRDAICSVINGHGWDVDASTHHIADTYANYVRHLAQLAETRKISEHQILHVSYHELSHHTEEQASRILDWLALEATDDFMNAVGEMASVQSHSLRGAQNNPTDFEISQSEGRWERELDERQMSVVQSVLIQIKEELDMADEWLQGGLPNYFESE